MKKYHKLLDLLVSLSDCVAFEIETYENLYAQTSEEEIAELFHSYIKSNLQVTENESVEYIKFKRRIIENEKMNKEQMFKALHSFDEIKNDILYKYLSLEFGVIKYFQVSKNLVIGFKISDDVTKYLHSVKEVFDWEGIKPSNITFYNKGKCIFQAISHDRVIFISDKKILEEVVKLNYPCYYKDEKEFYHIKYPYEQNNDKYIII